jgi:hypothetical protein
MFAPAERADKLPHISTPPQYVLCGLLCIPASSPNGAAPCHKYYLKQSFCHFYSKLRFFKKNTMKKCFWIVYGTYITLSRGNNILILILTKINT